MGTLYLPLVNNRYAYGLESLQTAETMFAGVAQTPPT